jgi:hypothetical protein
MSAKAFLHSSPRSTSSLLASASRLETGLSGCSATKADHHNIATMNASTIRDFFLGTATVDALANDVRDAWRWRASDSRELRMEDLLEDFRVESAHLVRVCDAVISNRLPASALEPIGFGAIASDHFTWDTDTEDGNRVAETLQDWSCPEVNFALTRETAEKFRTRLLSGEDRFTSADHFKGPKPARVSSWSSPGADAG